MGSATAAALPPMRVTVAAIACAASLVATAPASGAPRYNAVPLRSLGGSCTFGTGINIHGNVTGWALLPGDMLTRAFVDDGRRLTDLGTLGGADSSAAAINDRGAVTGSAKTASGRIHTFVHANGVMADLGTHGEPFCSSGSAINEAGQVAGTSDFACEANWRAEVYSGGTIVPLTGIGEWSQARGINERGQVAGWVSTPAGGRAFLHAGGTLMILGTLGGGHSEAMALNDAGDVVGFSELNDRPGRHAFLYADGRMSDLGTLGSTYSIANAINNRREIVGDSYTADGAPRAFLHAGGAMHDLHALVESGLDGATLTSASAINDRGQIVAIDRDLGVSPARCRTYRLDPIEAAPAAHEAGIPTLSQRVLAALSVLLAVGAALKLRRAP